MSPKGNKVKFSYGEETRAVSLPQMSFSGLLNTLETLVGQPQHRLAIKYLDEEDDLVSICSEPEFQEALNCFENSSLRLIVEPKEANDTPAVNHSLQFPEIQLNTHSSLIEPVELCPVHYELEEEEEKKKIEVLRQLAEVETTLWWEPGFIQRDEGAEQEVEVFNEEHEGEQLEVLEDLEPEVSVHQGENVDEAVVEPSRAEESKTSIEPKKKRNGRKKRQNKKQQQREKSLNKERKRAEDRERKREAKEKLKKMKDELSEVTSESKEKAEEIKNGLREEEEKQVELLNQLESLVNSIAQKKQLLRLHKKETKEQLKTLRSKIQTMEAEINDFKTREEKETYPVTESADVIQEQTQESGEAEETIDVYQSPKKKSDGKLKLVRFKLNAQDNDFWMNERDRDEELEHFEAELNTLAFMGFKNVHRNLCLLRKFQGNVEHVVDQLIPV